MRSHCTRSLHSFRVHTSQCSKTHVLNWVLLWVLSHVSSYVHASSSAFAFCFRYMLQLAKCPSFSEHAHCAPRSLSSLSVCTKAFWVLSSGRQPMPDTALQPLVHRTSANVFLFMSLVALIVFLELHVSGFYAKFYLKSSCPRAITHSCSFCMDSWFIAHGRGSHCHMMSSLMGGPVVVEPSPRDRVFALHALISFMPCSCPMS